MKNFDSDHKRFHYKEVMDLGFKRYAESDSVFFDQNGYDWFRVEFKLKKNLYMEWDSETHRVQLIKFKPSDGSIVSRVDMDSLWEMKKQIKLYKPKKYKPEPLKNNIISAA